jgi:serine/threonine-protein kinase
VATRSQRTEWTGQTLFGKWKVESLIGIGGTSTVLQARHRNGRRAALKILHPHLVGNARTRERFLREARLANLVKHPGVVTVYDDFIAEDGTAVLVLELVSGQNLATRAKSLGGVLSPQEVVDAARIVLEILTVAHDAGVIHRDIKPENILLSSTGRYKLADFGLAGLFHELGVLTASNASMGTPAYMSPEQARGDAQQVDARTDLWGLGATMFTLLTGRFLHEAGAPRNLLVAAATEQAPSIRSVEPGIAPDLASVVDRALRMDREERWPSARAMAEALALVRPEASHTHAPPQVPSSGETTVPTPLSTIVSRSGPRSGAVGLGYRSRRHSAFAAVTALCVAVVGAVVISRKNGERGHADDASSGVPSQGFVPSRGFDEAPATRGTPGPSASTSAASIGPVRHRPKPQLQRVSRAVSTSGPAPDPASSAPSIISSPGDADFSVSDEVLDRRQ